MFKKFVFQFLFFQADYLVKRSRSKVISESDFLDLPKALDPLENNALSVEDLRKSTLQFLLSLPGLYRGRALRAYVLLFLTLVGSLATPILLHAFIKRISEGSSLGGNLWLGLALAFCGVFVGLCNQHYFYQCLGAFQMISNDLNQLIFKKSLKLSLQARAQSQIGDIVNHMSSDADTIADFLVMLGDLGWTLAMVISASAMLFVYIGWSAVPPLLILAGLAPLTRMIAKKFIRYEKAMMDQRDSRVTLISQILQSIRVVKYFAWEKAVSREVEDIRNQELGSRQKLARAEVLSGVSYVAVSSLVLFVALFVHALRGFAIDAALIFTSISLFGLLEEPFGQLSRLFSRLTQAYVSTTRLQKFLAQAEVPETQKFLSADSNLAFELKDVSFYHSDPALPVLEHLNLKIRKTQSVAIVGPVGAGKTSLLYGLLGECRSLGGQILKNENSKVAYVSQEAYIVNSSLLENLSFGLKDVSPELLRRCIDAACLEKDIQDLPAGLRTEIGEKGVNLSGGQKQRVSLARAAISQPDIVLLDDPLSAVDVETEKHLCDRLLFGLWAKTTRVVVTHRLESLDRFDVVLYVKDGKIAASGALQELLTSAPEFVDFYSRYEMREQEPQRLPESRAEVAVPPTEGRITQDEERETGAVKSKVFKDYILSLGGNGVWQKYILVGLVLSAVLSATLPLLQKWWLSYYSGHSLAWTATVAIGIYGVIGVFVLLGSLVNQLFWLERGIASGRDLHAQMLKSLLRAPIRFFDSTPVGRILQRFSRDMESVDIYLQWSFESFVQCLLQVSVSLLLIAFVIPPMVLVIAPLFWLYYRLQLDYRRPAREAKRLDSIARSPRYAHYKETLLGLPVIRAYHREPWFLSEFFARLQHSQRMFYGHYMLNRWFSSRIPLLGGAISLATISAVSIFASQGWISPGTAGLVTIYSLSFWFQLNWGIRIFADIESRMTSVERLKFYGSIPPEAGQDLPVKELPHWPKSGEVRAVALQARYAEHLPWVIRGLDFHIKAGQKVGIIGRTGSGKSTLFQALYRFVEAEVGHIEIDGVDIKTLPLAQLRKALAIVPQDPSLFLGTLRSNLDRYQEYSDAEVWSVLAQTGLEKFIRGLPQGLLSSVQENGANLSQGQRQLLCLARALLIKAKIVLMDEATASVDVQTDQQIQSVIRESLCNTTVLIIAHRLGTLDDCDQVIEIADGRLRSQRAHLSESAMRELDPELIE